MIEIKIPARTTRVMKAMADYPAKVKASYQDALMNEARKLLGKAWRDQMRVLVNQDTKRLKRALCKLFGHNWKPWRGTSNCIRHAICHGEARGATCRRCERETLEVRCQKEPEWIFDH